MRLRVAVTVLKACFVGEDPAAFLSRMTILSSRSGARDLRALVCTLVGLVRGVLVMAVTLRDCHYVMGMKLARDAFLFYF